MKRKKIYSKVSGFWIYTIQIPSVNKYYIGVSGMKECRYRWKKTSYLGTTLEPYLDEWQSMIKTVIQDGLTREEALKKEDELIQVLSKKGLIINKKRSGLIEVNDKKQYSNQYYEDNKEQMNQCNKQWQKDNRKKWNEYQRQWYENNKEKMREYQKQKQKEYYEKNKEKIKQRNKENRLKKKLEQQQNNILNNNQL